jgi:radical SAM superfamily enzyme YgiQ (UPF0313 family)
MWIKLMSPPSTLRPMDTAFKSHMAPPLSLLVLGALTPGDHRVTLQDGNIERLRLDDRPDLVGITVKVDTVPRAREIARAYRERGIPVVVGGIYPTVCPEPCLSFADAVVVGEAEDVWPGLLIDLQSGKLKSVYTDPGRSCRKPVIPRWELLRGKNYLITNTVVTSQGCPWKCDFCYRSSPNIPSRYKMKPLRSVLAEIASLGTRHVFFIDDNFIGNPNRARALMQALMPLGLTWHAAVSADVGRHEDILDLMALTGCRSLFIGFETLNERNIAASGKRQNRVAEYGETIRKIHERGMMVNASLVFGFDDDTTGTFPATLDWLTARKVETMTAHILTPFPGTRLYNRLLGEGRMVDFDLAHYNTARAVFRPLRMAPQELEEGLRWMYREFYSWRRIYQRLPEAPGQWTAHLLFNVLYRKLGPAVAWVGRMGIMGGLARFARVLAYRDRGPAACRQPNGFREESMRLT